MMITTRNPAARCRRPPLLRQWFLLSVLFLITVSTAVTRAQDYAPDKPPPSKWYIDTPTFTADRLDVFLKYPISDIIPYDNIEWTLLTDCSGGTDITENDYLAVALTIDDESVPEGDGTGWRNVTLSFTFDPTTIRSSPILTTVNLDDRLQFCVHLSAYSAPTIVPGSLEIYYKETTVDVLIEQDGEANVDNSVVTPVENDESDLYTLRGYLCNETNHEVIDPIPIFQGTLTKVCVTPSDEARAAGVYMHSIDSFYWMRETIYQTAIYPHQTTEPLSKITCEPGMIVCSFVTLLKGDFFYKLGNVVGAGMGWLQMGKGNYTGDQRYLKKVAIELKDNNLPKTSTSRHLNRPDGATYDNYAGAGPFVVDLPVTRLYRAYGWLCDKDNKKLDAKENPIVMGDVARVCVTPDDIGINQDNVRVRSIDSFTWLRDDLNMTQIAITSNAKAEDRTEIFCEPGSVVCAFETNLLDGFYDGPGAVQGDGIVWLQFGSDSSRMLKVSLQLVEQNILQHRRRHLQYGLEDFDLGASLLPTADPGFAGASPFEVVVYVLPPVEERELYSCRAYECDFNNTEIVSNEPKGEGDSVRICVKPSEQAVEAGATMWSIEWWQWSQVDRIQDAVVQQGLEAPDGKTVLFCYRGMEVCFFQTNLMPEFFSKPQPNILNGNGVCWLTFGQQFTFPAPIDLENSPAKKEKKVDPTKDALYAGQNNITITFPTDGDFVASEEACPPEVHSVNQWWHDLEGPAKAAIISAIALASIGLCCAWGLCFFCNRRDRRVEDVILEDGKVVVNVDVNGSKNTTKTATSTTEQSSEKRSKEISTDTTQLSSTTESDSKSKFDGKCSKSDIIFDDNEHPGTVKLRQKLRAYIIEKPNVEYGPGPYCDLRASFKDSFFLIHDSNARKLRESTRFEAIKKIGEIWLMEKSQLQKKGSTNLRGNSAKRQAKK